MAVVGLWSAAGGELIEVVVVAVAGVVGFEGVSGWVVVSAVDAGVVVAGEHGLSDALPLPGWWELVASAASGPGHLSAFGD